MRARSRGSARGEGGSSACISSSSAQAAAGAATAEWAPRPARGRESLQCGVVRSAGPPSAAACCCGASPPRRGSRSVARPPRAARRSSSAACLRPLAVLRLRCEYRKALTVRAGGGGPLAMQPVLREGPQVLGRAVRHAPPLAADEGVQGLHACGAQWCAYPSLGAGLDRDARWAVKPLPVGGGPHCLGRPPGC